MDDLFQNIIASEPATKLAPLPSTTYHILNAQCEDDAALVTAILQRLHTDDESTALETILLLLNASFQGAVTGEAVDSLVETVVEYGKHHVEWAEPTRWLMALLHYHANSELTVSLMAESGAVSIAVDSLRTFPNDLPTCRAACTLLCSFGCYPIEHGLRDVTATLQRHSNDVFLLRKGLRVLEEFTTYYGGSTDALVGICEDILCSGGPAIILSTLEERTAEPAILQSACRLVANVCIANTERCTQELIKTGCVEKALALIDSLPDDTALVVHGLHIIGSIVAFTEPEQRGAFAVRTMEILSKFAEVETVQTEGIRTLSSLAMNAKETKPYMADHGGVLLIVGAMRRFPGNATLNQEACNLISYLSFDSELITSIITTNEGIQLVLEAMKRFEANENILMAACAALSGLTFNSLVGQGIVSRNDGIRIVLNAMQKGEKPRLQEMACLALGTMCWNVELKAEVVNAGGIRCILKALEKHMSSPGVVKNACRALAQIAFNSEPYRNEMSAMGAISLILQAMELHPTHDRAQMHACVALSYLSWTNEANATEIAHRNGFQLIVLAMKNHPMNHEVQEHGCRALANISNVTPVDAELGIQQIIEAMARHEHVVEVQEEACRAMVTLALASPRNKDILYNQHAAEYVTTAMKNFPLNHVVQQEACNALAHLAYEHEKLNRVVTDLGGAKLLLTAMGNFPTNAKLQLNACGGLSALAFDNSIAQREIFDCGGVDLVIRAMNTYDRLRMLELGCSVLGTLAWNAEIKEKVAIKAVPEILRCMKVYADNSLLQKSTCRAISQFAFNSEHNRRLLYESQCIPLIIGALKCHRTKDKLVSHALVALTYLCWENPDVAQAIIAEGALDVLRTVEEDYANDEKVLSKATHLRKILYKKSASQVTPGMASPPRPPEIMTPPFEMHALMDADSTPFPLDTLTPSGSPNQLEENDGEGHTNSRRRGESNNRSRPFYSSTNADASVAPPPAEGDGRQYAPHRSGRWDEEGRGNYNRRGEYWHRGGRDGFEEQYSGGRGFSRGRYNREDQSERQPRRRWGGEPWRGGGDAWNDSDGRNNGDAAENSNMRRGFFGSRSRRARGGRGGENA